MVWDHEVAGSNPVAPIFFGLRPKKLEQERSGTVEQVKETGLIACKGLSCGHLLTLLSSSEDRSWPSCSRNWRCIKERSLLADTVAGLTQDFPRGYGFLVDQLNRAALPIATNLAEGNGRFTKPDRKNFFTIARGSVQECIPLMEVARQRGLIDQSKHESLRADLETIAKMISGLINGLENRDGRQGCCRLDFSTA